MGALTVKELPFPVNIAGDSPTPEEAGDLIKVVEDYQANPDKYASVVPKLDPDAGMQDAGPIKVRFGSTANPQNKIDVTHAFSGNASGIDSLTGELPSGWKQIARAAMKVPSDVAQNYALPLATMPYKIGKELFNAATLPADIYDRAGERTDYGRQARQTVPELEAGTAADLGGTIGSFATGVGALGTLGKFAQLPEKVNAISGALGRIGGSTLAGTAVTDPDRPTVGNLIPGIRNFVPETGYQKPALDNRFAHLIDQLGMGAFLEGGASLLPSAARTLRDLGQGVAGKGGIDRKTAQGLQAAAGGPEASKRAAVDIANRPLLGDLPPGFFPTTAEVTDNLGLKGLQGTMEQRGSKTAAENTAPSTALAERNAANEAAVRAERDQVLPPTDLDATAPLEGSARARAADLEGARNAETDTARQTAEEATHRAAAEVEARRALAESDAAAARSEQEDMLAELGGERSRINQGNASAQVSDIVDNELTRLRNVKNERYKALRTDEPVNPERIAATLHDIFTPPSRTSRVTEDLAASPTVARIRMLALQQSPVDAIDALATAMAERTGREGSSKISIGALGPQARQQMIDAFRPDAAKALGVDLANPSSMAKITTTDLIDALPDLTAEINAARKQAATNGTQGDLVPRLVALKRAISIRSPEDVEALIGGARPEYQDAARDAITAFQTYADRFKRGAGKEISVARARGEPVAPSGVVGNYLGSGGAGGSRERVGQLLDTIRGAPDEAARQGGEGALRDWLIGELGARTTRGESVSPATIRAFRTQWGEVLDQMPPALREELATLERNVGASNERVAATRERAGAAAKLTPDDIEQAVPGGKEPSLADLQERIKSAANPTKEETALVELGDKLGADPVAVFSKGMGAPRPLGDQGIGPLLRIAGTTEQKNALKGLATIHLREVMGDNLGGAAEVLSNPAQRAALARIFSPAELARLDAVNGYSAGRRAIKAVPSTGTFPTLRLPGKGVVGWLKDFVLGGMAGKIASALKDALGGDTKAVAERALMDVLTDPAAALKALRLNTADEGGVINFLKAYASQPIPGASTAIGEPIRREKEAQQNAR